MWSWQGKALNWDSNQIPLVAIAFLFIVVAVGRGGAFSFLVFIVTKSYYGSFVQEQQLQLPVKGQDVS